MKKFFFITCFIFLSFILVACTDSEKALTMALNEENFLNYKMVLKMQSTINDKQINEITSTLYVQDDFLYNTVTGSLINSETYIFKYNDKKYYVTKVNNGSYTVTEITSLSQEDTFKKSIGVLPDFNPTDFEKGKDGYYYIKEEKLSSYNDFLTTNLTIFGVTIFQIDDTYFKIALKRKKVSEILYGFKLTFFGQNLSFASSIVLDSYGKVKIEVPKEILDLVS